MSFLSSLFLFTVFILQVVKWNIYWLTLEIFWHVLKQVSYFPRMLKDSYLVNEDLNKQIHSLLLLTVKHLHLKKKKWKVLKLDKFLFICLGMIIMQYYLIGKPFLLKAFSVKKWREKGMHRFSRCLFLFIDIGKLLRILLSHQSKIY